MKTRAYPLFCLLACLLLPATALAQPVFKAIDRQTVEDNDFIEFDAPGSTAVGDFMLVVIALSDDEPVTGTPSGWTELTDYNVSRVRVWVGWKFAQSGDLGDSFRWDFDDDADIVGHLRVYSNVDPLNPINAWDEDDDDSNDVVAPAVTTTVSDTMIVRMYGAEEISHPDPIDPLHNNEYFDDACDCVEDGVQVGSADLPQPAAGDSGTASWDNLDEDDWIAVTVALAPAISRATFIISKDWDQAGDQDGLNAIEVTGHLSCTGGTPTQQDVVFTATTDAILFVYNIALAEGAVNCKVTETVPDNYTAEYVCDSDNCADTADNGLDHCFFYDIDDHPNDTYSCIIINTPDPATVTVTKTWVIEGADQGFDGSHEIWGTCDSNDKTEVLIYGGSHGCVDGHCNAWVEVDNATTGSIDYEFTIVNPAYPSSDCNFYEETFDNVIESDNGCGEMKLSAGDDVDCEIVNTVFFEGIPTLSHYGMAILAVLMLGVGLVGFRRFV